MKKNNKKKFLGVFLFLFALAGVVGYGAYSYYWTDGSVSSNTESIEVASFNPTLYVNGEHTFLHIGDESGITLDCPSTSNGVEVVTCTGTVEVYNNGDTDIILSVDTDDSEISTHQESGSVNTNVTDVTYSWSSTSVSPGSYSTLTVTAYIDFDNGTSGGFDGDSAEYVLYAVSGGTTEVTANVVIIATQAH